MTEAIAFWPPQASEYATHIDALMWGFTAVIVLLTGPVFLLIIYFSVKYRRSKPADREHAASRSVGLETAWAVGPFLLTIGFFVYAAWLFFIDHRPPADALTISPDVIAVHLVKLEGPEPDKGEAELREQWRLEVAEPVEARGMKAPQLKFISAPYRELVDPLVTFLRQLDEETPGRAVAVLIPEIVQQHWWQSLLHVHRARRLRTALLRQGGPRLTVASVPWRLDRPAKHPAEAENAEE